MKTKTTVQELINKHLEQEGSGDVITMYCVAGENEVFVEDTLEGSGDRYPLWAIHVQDNDDDTITVFGYSNPHAVNIFLADSLDAEIEYEVFVPLK